MCCLRSFFFKKTPLQTSHSSIAVAISVLFCNEKGVFIRINFNLVNFNLQLSSSYKEVDVKVQIMYFTVMDKHTGIGFVPKFAVFQPLRGLHLWIFSLVAI